MGPAPARARFNTQEGLQAQPGILIVAKAGLPFARLGEDLFALRNRERRLFQILTGECDRAVLYRTHARAHEPLLQDRNAAHGTLIEKLPYGHEVRFRFGKWKLLLEGEENTLEYLAVSGRISSLALEMQVHTATAQLGAEIPKRQQLVCSQQNMDGLSSISYRLDDVQLIR